MTELLDELPPLSKRQEECIRLLAHFWLQHRHMPTQKEIAAEMKISSAAAQGHIEALVKKGYLTRIPGQRRNIRITTNGLEKLKMLGEATTDQQELFT